MAPALLKSACMDKPLVVDDEREIALVFGADDLTVLTAGDGIAALEIAREEHLRLVLTDVMRPRMGGVELCRRLWETPEIRDTAVLLMSVARRMDVSGCDPVGVIRKPFDLGSLVDTVRRHFVTSSQSGGSHGCLSAAVLETGQPKEQTSLLPKGRMW